MGRMKVDMDLSEFPRDIQLKYGREGNREWYEFIKGKKAIVIQRTKPDPYWKIFFINGDVIRVLEEELSNEERRRGLVGKAFCSKNLDDCLEALRKLGFIVR